jgi:spore coat protein SA
MIYHLLTENECFSAIEGGAIARWVANVLRPLQDRVACAAADTSYNFSEHRLKRIPSLMTLRKYSRLVRALPAPVLKYTLQSSVEALISCLRPGDVLWIHNRPDFAWALFDHVRRAGATIVLHMHNSHLLRCTSDQIQVLNRLPIVFCSSYLLKEASTLRAWDNPTCKVIYNGACCPPRSAGANDSDREPTVVFAGRLVPEKGVHILLEAMSILEQEKVRVSCTIIGGAWFGSTGKSHYITSLRRTAPANARFAGYLTGDALIREVAAADIFCCPSVWQEPFPMSNLEALAVGLPVVASRVGGIPEGLQYGGGILVPPNDPVALAAALRSLIVDIELRTRMGSEAVRAHRNHFSWDKIRNDYNAVLQEVR